VCIDFVGGNFIGHTANLPFVGKFHNDWPKSNTSCRGFGNILEIFKILDVINKYEKLYLGFVVPGISKYSNKNIQPDATINRKIYCLVAIIFTIDSCIWLDVFI
jgi:hypothetical protein